MTREKNAEVSNRMNAASVINIHAMKFNLQKLMFSLHWFEKAIKILWRILMRSHCMQTLHAIHIKKNCAKQNKNAITIPY